jgi:hypothetical protein
MDLKLHVRLVCFFLLFFSVSAATGAQDLTIDEVKALPECSLSKTNNACRLAIDRSNPVAPPTVQMYSDQRLTVVVKNPKFYERYFLDYQSGQATLTPDVASSIIQALLVPLGKLAFSANFMVATVPPPADPCADPRVVNMPQPGQVGNAAQAFQVCFAKLSNDAVAIYKQLEPLIAPDSITPNGPPQDGDLDAIEREISNFLPAEWAVSSKISAILNDAGLKASVPDGQAMTQLSGYQKVFDSLAGDLMAYAQRLTDLDRGLDNGAQDCKDMIEITEAEKTDNIQCVYLTSRPDNSRVYQKMVTRAITYSLDTLNMVSNSQEAAVDPSKKKLLASISLNFADAPVNAAQKSSGVALRWEGSAGAFFSSLPVRSFSAAPVFTNGVVTNKMISQNVLHPTVVPFAAANYRLSNDLKWSRWKSAIYWTTAVGVNPNTVSADFATGPSISWRGLMVSALCHFGHDVRLTQGLTVGEDLGASFNGSLSTKTYWTESFAVGVSVRIPAITGR